MFKRIVTSALVLAVGCTAQIREDRSFEHIANTRDKLEQGVHPTEKEMEIRWRYSQMLREVIKWYEIGRPSKEHVDPFLFIVEYCRLSNQNTQRAERVCAETNVCDNMYLIQNNNIETQKTCKKLVYESP